MFVKRASEFLSKTNNDMLLLKPKPISRFDNYLSEQTRYGRCWVLTIFHHNPASWKSTRFPITWFFRFSLTKPYLNNKYSPSRRVSPAPIQSRVWLTIQSKINQPNQNPQVSARICVEHRDLPTSVSQLLHESRFVVNRALTLWCAFCQLITRAKSWLKRKLWSQRTKRSWGQAWHHWLKKSDVMVFSDILVDDTVDGWNPAPVDR